MASSKHGRDIDRAECWGRESHCSGIALSIKLSSTTLFLAIHKDQEWLEIPGGRLGLVTPVLSMMSYGQRRAVKANYWATRCKANPVYQYKPGRVL